MKNENLYQAINIEITKLVAECTSKVLGLLQEQSLKQLVELASIPPAPKVPEIAHPKITTLPPVSDPVTAKIVEVLKAHPQGIRSTALQRATRMNADKIRDCLNGLAAFGVIAKTGRRRSTLYTLS